MLRRSYQVLSKSLFKSYEDSDSTCKGTWKYHQLTLPSQTFWDSTYRIACTRTCLYFFVWQDVTVRSRDDLIQDPQLHSTTIWRHSVHPSTTGAVASEGWGAADYAAAVNQVPSCHELRLDKSRTEVWTNWPLPLLVLLLLLFLSVSQVRSNSVFLFKDCRDLSTIMLPAFAWRLDLSRWIAECNG